MTRPRLAKLQALAADVAQAARSLRAGRPSPGRRPAPAAGTEEELIRRLDDTRERLRREIPPRGDASS